MTEIRWHSVASVNHGVRIGNLYLVGTLVRGIGVQRHAGTLI